MRQCGILLAVSSLPNKYGIGCFSKEAYEFVDFLSDSKQKIWQILPLGPTGYGDSPYQSFSTFAGNPYFIDPSDLVDRGYISLKECEKLLKNDNNRYVDYEFLYKKRFKMLRKAFEGFKKCPQNAFKAFIKAEKEWLEDYSLYMALKDENGGKSFYLWEDDLRFRKPAVMKAAKARLSDDIYFYEFLQYMFFEQWLKLKAYANEKGISIMGDIPIYVALDSADTWSHPELFQFDEKGYPKGVAGCPPDYFSKTGQLWGNPLYDWEVLKENDYAWWMGRLSHCFRLFDILRIDHFRGFDEYYFVPWKDETAENGHWVKGPGYDFFKVMNEKLGKRSVVAEDLGYLTKTVKRLVKRTGYPGMKILEFAFDSDPDCEYLPHNYGTNSVVYTGTHDNDTVFGWYKSLPSKNKKFVKEYLGTTSPKDLNKKMIHAALFSTADTAVIPMQDLLGLGSEGRMNTPSTLGFNWQWRMLPGEYTKDMAESLAHLCVLSGRAK